MKDVMLAETPIDEREQIMRDSCDQILERSYTMKFDQTEINERCADLVNVSALINEVWGEIPHPLKKFQIWRKRTIYHLCLSMLESGSLCQW